MGDVFISYSRRDVVFAQRLNTAFVAANRVVWVDLQDIPPGEAWEREIELGIESSNSFICVISEHWLTSEVCHRELQHARQNNKRIFPLIRQRIEGEAEKRVKGTWMDLPYEQTARDNWDFIRHLNWVFFDVDEKFKTEFEALLTALDEEQPHVKAHTRYQNRALEWENSGQNPSFLMDGDELVFSEQWLATADAEEKDPLPTDLQRRYIKSSRETEETRKALELVRERRTRNFQRASAGLAVFMVLAILVAALAGMRAISSVNQISEINATATLISMEIEAKEARLEALRLGEEANRIREIYGVIDLPALLSIRALQLAYSLEADKVLSSQLYSFNQRRLFEGHTRVINSVVFSPDGDLILTGSADGTTRLWDIKSQKTLYIFEQDYGVESAIFSPDGRYILTFGGGTTAQLWDTQSKEEIHKFDIDNINSAAFSPDGHYILTGGSTTAQLWNIQSEQIIRIFSGHTDIVTSVVFSPDGQFVLTGSWDMTARLWDVQGGQEIRVFSRASEYLETYFIEDLAFSPNGCFLLTADRNIDVILWDVQNGQIIHILRGHTDQINDVAFSPDGQFFLTGSSDNTARLWDANTGAELRVFSGHTDAVTSVAFSPDGQFVLTGSWDGTVRLWDTDYHSFITYACTQVSRDFTSDERRQYGIPDSEPTCPQFASEEE